MIPISDDNPARLRPVVTWGIILACVLAYVWELSLGDEMDAAVLVFGFTPASLFTNYAPAGVGQVPAALTIFTSMFLHGSVLHIAGNMLFLWIFGDNVEDAMGHARYLLFYLAGGVCAAAAQTLVDPTSTIPMVGASGAISAVLAAYVFLYPRSPITVLNPIILLWLFFGLTMTFPAWLVIGIFF